MDELKMDESNYAFRGCDGAESVVTDPEYGTLVEYSGDIEFVYFDTNNDCEKFLNFVSQQNITISHKCCGGNGCGVKNIKKEQLKIIITPLKI